MPPRSSPVNASAYAMASRVSWTFAWADSSTEPRMMASTGRTAVSASKGCVEEAPGPGSGREQLPVVSSSCAIGPLWQRIISTTGSELYPQPLAFREWRRRFVVEKEQKNPCYGLESGPRLTLGGGRL